MATAEDERDRDVPSDSETSAGSDNASDSGEVEPIEWLVTARAKRSTAGNRMKSMLANEEPAADDSDLELLFAEDEDDVGFTDEEKEDASDVLMDSSSDEEDQGDGGDDLEGEKELIRQAKAKKTAQRKRGAQEAIPVKFRKKVRIEQPATRSQSPASSAPTRSRPKKKSERTSWLPTATDLPTRASERHTTRLSKEQLHQQMVERELKREKQLVMLEKKAKRLEAMKKPPMTQADRLAEAALVEKRNAKSLNRWEEAEKQREEERLKKIAALHSRELDGPVVSFWSGIQELEEGQMKHIGKMVSVEEKAPRKKKQPAAPTVAEQQAGDAVKTESESKPIPPGDSTADKPVGDGDQKATQAPASTPNVPPEPSSATVEQAPPAPSAAPAPPLPSPPAQTSQAPATAVSSPAVTPSTPSLSVPRSQSAGALAPPAPRSALVPPRGPTAPPPIPPPPEMRSSSAGFLAAPVLMAPSGASPGGHMPALGFSSPSARSNVLAAPNTTHGGQSPLPSAPSPSHLSMSQVPPAPTPPPAPKPTAPTPSRTASTPLQSIQGRAPPKKAPEPAQEAPPEPPLEGKVTKSCIILQNFDENAIKDRQVQTQILFGRKMNKLASEYHVSPCLPVPPSAQGY